MESELVTTPPRGKSPYYFKFASELVRAPLNRERQPLRWLLPCKHVSSTCTWIRTNSDSNLNYVISTLAAGEFILIRFESELVRKLLGADGAFMVGRRYSGKPKPRLFWCSSNTQMQTEICKHSNRFQIIHLLSALTFAFRLCEALFASRDLPGMRVTQAKVHVSMYDMKASTSA